MRHIDNRGFSLLEVIIAIAIFAVGAGGLYAMQLTSAKGNTRANQQTGAVTAASQAVEQLMREDYTSSALTPTMSDMTTRLSDPHDSGDELPDVVIDQAPYINSIQWDVIDLGVSDSNYEGVKRVMLTVTYGDRRVDLTFLRISLI